MKPAKAGGKPLVSILIFTYNHAPYIKKALDSVLGQEGSFTAEIIIHDDASSDGTAEIIEEYYERYPDMIVPVLQKENQKQKGVNYISLFVNPLVRGKYVAYCEGDDYWTDPRKLAIQLHILQSHPEYSGVSHNCIVVDEFGRRLKPVNKFYPFRKNFVYTLKELSYESRMPGQTASVVIRSRIVYDTPEAEREASKGLRTCLGDRKRTLIMLLNGPVLCLKRPMSAYRYVTEGGSSWNAQTHGKNLAGRYFVEEYDFRAFSKTFYGIRLRNQYVLFGTGLMAAFRVWRHPSEENEAQYQYVLDAVGGKKELLRFLIKCFPGAVLTVPPKIIQEIVWRFF